MTGPGEGIDAGAVNAARNPVEPNDVKGILHPDEQARHRSMRRLMPGARMSSVVEWCWAVRWDLRGRPPYLAQVLPYPSVNVTFERTDSHTGGFVSGVYTSRFTRELSGAGEVFGIRFRVGGFGAFTGVEVGALRDAALPLTEVLPRAQGLADRVLALPTDEQRRECVEEFFATGMDVDDPTYRLVLRIIDDMVHDHGLTRVDQITQRFDVPMRTLQRMFRRYVGAGPKWVLRRYRLQDGADLLARGRVDDLAALATELGYFDQAHFSREFATEIGMAPLEYAKSSLHSRNEVTAKVLPQ